MNKKKIKILKNGPYEVSGGVPLKQAVIATDEAGTSEGWQEGKDYGQGDQETYCLCRCGHSKNKPFCDGKHTDIGFKGEEKAGHEPYLSGVTVYEGEAVDLLDNESLCASLRFCDKGLRVWDLAIQSGDPENRELAIEEACNCAAGRLTIVDKKGKMIEPKLPQEISPIEDTAADCRGPLWVKGGIEVEGADGKAYEVRNRMTLCRCGESQNMPFCDTRHRSCPHMQGLDDE